LSDKSETAPLDLAALRRRLERDGFAESADVVPMLALLDRVERAERERLLLLDALEECARYTGCTCYPFSSGCAACSATETLRALAEKGDGR